MNETSGLGCPLFSPTPTPTPTPSSSSPAKLSHCLLVLTDDRTHRILVRTLPGMRRSGSGARDLLCLLLAVWPWESFFTSLSLSFPMWKMEIKLIPTCRDFCEDKITQVKRMLCTKIGSGYSANEQMLVVVVLFRRILRLECIGQVAGASVGMERPEFQPPWLDKHRLEGLFTTQILRAHPQSRGGLCRVSGS